MAGNPEFQNWRWMRRAEALPPRHVDPVLASLDAPRLDLFLDIAVITMSSSLSAEDEDVSLHL